MLPYTTYLIDLDGVVYRGNELLPGLANLSPGWRAIRKNTSS